MKCVNISNIAIITVNGADSLCITPSIRKFDEIDLLKSYVIDDRGYAQKMHANKIHIKNRVCN